MSGVGSFVTRGDGSCWQVAEVRISHRCHRLGNTLPPVPTTTFVLERGGRTEQVEVWGAGAAERIGREPAEVLTPTVAPVALGGAA